MTDQPHAPSTAVRSFAAGERASWREAAACRGSDPDLFFPERGDSEAIRLAREVCASCPVQVECLDYALGELSGNEYGIYAGTTNRERRRLIRQRRAA
jgi:WhiB family redox-sensing transcriptional regulator